MLRTVNSDERTQAVVDMDPECESAGLQDAEDFDFDF
jgi:hypothetical protein